MEKQQAIQLLDQVFNHSFDQQQFGRFVGETFNEVNTQKELRYQGNRVYKPYQDHIVSCRRIGQYRDPEGALLDILIVKVRDPRQLDRARTRLRNFIIEYLKERIAKSPDYRETVLVAFHAEDRPDWRLSFIRLETVARQDETSGKVKLEDKITSARRYSFLVGHGEPSHTIQKQLLPLLADSKHNPTLTQIEEAFGIEKVAKEFFDRYKGLFLKLQEELEGLIQRDGVIQADFAEKGIQTAAFAKKLLGQIVFLYFIQKKGWLGVAKDKNFGDGDKAFLRSLFERAVDSGKNYFNDFLEPLFYEALAVERKSADPSWYKPFACRIPFLNGGLFEPIADYNWQKTDIVIPNTIFHNTEVTKENDVGTGILDVFDRYNFTVREDEPLEKEVAVDPEMLGKVFENLLEVKDRKSKGAFYTPREIVHYMCQESLINYLDTALNGDAEQDDAGVPRGQIEEFIKHSHLMVEDSRTDKYRKSWEVPQAMRNCAAAVDTALTDIKLCDPAIGSGAFPVGMLTEIVQARRAITPHLSKTAQAKDRSPYHLKRDCIENSIYGVDIDSSAIDIAKLRLWLSLVVDEESLTDIDPLPNLDYKIVCGNSLLGVERGNMFVAIQLSKLETKKKEYFDATHHQTKKKLKREIDKLILEITDGNRQFDFQVYFSEVWHDRDGFDVVIANPPYVEFKNLPETVKKTLTDFESTKGKYDLYIPFLEKAKELINNDGIATFICPTRFLIRNYGKSIRTVLSRECSFRLIVDFSDVQVFDTALNYTGIFIYGLKKNNTHFTYKSIKSSSGLSAMELESALLTYYSNDRVEILHLPNNILNINTWHFHNQKDDALLEKLETNAVPLYQLCDGIYQGISTGKDAVFVLNDDKISELQIESQIAIPFLKGKDIHRYQIVWRDKYLIYPYDKDGNVISENNLKKQFPNTYAYLKSVRNELRGRGYFDKSQKKWYELWNQRNLRRFTQYKLMTLDNAQRNSFAFDKGVFVGTTTTYSLILKNKDINNYMFMLGLLNSHLMEYHHKKKTIPQAGGFYRYQASLIKHLPIMRSNLNENCHIIDCVTKILKITQKRDYIGNPTKQAEVKKIENRIDQMVYKLYGLTDEEIKIVEGG